jgi:hypothetical protein
MNQVTINKLEINSQRVDLAPQSDGITAVRRMGSSSEK